MKSCAGAAEVSWLWLAVGLAVCDVQTRITVDLVTMIHVLRPCEHIPISIATVVVEILKRRILRLTIIYLVSWSIATNLYRLAHRGA